MTSAFNGTRIRISFWFAAAVTLLFIVDKSGRLPLGIVGASAHECGHLLCMLVLGDIPEEIAILPIGMRITRHENIKISFAQETAVALSGVAVNLLLSAVMLFANLLLGTRFDYAVKVNLTLAAFNLLPIEALDGGRALYCFLCRFAEEEKVQKICTAVSLATLFPLGVFGFLILINSGYNFTLLLTTLYLVAVSVVSINRRAN